MQSNQTPESEKLQKEIAITIDGEKQTQGDLSTFKSFVLNVTDGHSYDRAFQMYKVRDRNVVSVSADELREIHRALLALRHQSEESKELTFLESAAKVRDIVKHVGFNNTTVNFECCSPYGGGCSTFHNKNLHFLFLTQEKSIAAIDLIVFMLSMGSQVICADFALKSLISNWDDSKFGAECPLKNINTIQGSLRVRYGIEPCKESDFPQIRSLAQLALPDRNDAMDDETKTTNQTLDHVAVSSVTMEAMGSTIVYEINQKVDPKLTIKVLSVAVGHVEHRNVPSTFPPQLPPLVPPLLQSQTEKPGKPMTLMPPVPQLCGKHLATVPVSTVSSCPIPPLGPISPFDPISPLGPIPLGLMPLKLKRQTAYGVSPNAEELQLEKTLSPKKMKVPQNPVVPVKDQLADNQEDEQEDVPPLLQPLQRQFTMAAEPVRHIDYTGLIAETIVPFPESDSFATAHGTHLRGMPVHTVITFEHLPGSLVVSSLHLTNLIQVNTDTEHILSVATNVLGRQRSIEMGHALARANAMQRPELLRATTSALVSEITSGSSALPRSSKSDNTDPNFQK